MKQQVIVNAPEKKTIIAGLSYGLISILGISRIMALMSYGYPGDLGALAWMELFYLTINAIILLFIFGRHLAESWFEVTLDVKKFIRTILVTCGYILMYAVAVFMTDHLFPEVNVFNVIPISESSSLIHGTLVLAEKPLLGVAAMTLLAPVTISCLFYGTVFAPLCSEHPVRAYIVMAIVLAVPHLYNILIKGWPEFEIITYLLRLPIHLWACRAYQKTDTIWAPIISLSIANLVCSIVVAVLFHIGFLYVV